MGAPAAAASAALAGNSFVILSVSVVGILAISLLLLAYYLFLTKCGLASWRRAAATHFHGTITVYSPAAPAPARRGLEDAAIRRIPTFRYRNKPLQAELAAASECAVCLGEFRDGERLRLLPPCLHAFHIDCIDAWLLATANCPLCRAAVSGSGYAPHVHVDIVTVLQAGATAAVSNADHVVIDIPSPSPGDMAGSGSEVGGSSGSGGGGGKMSMRDDQCIDLRRDDDGDLLSGVLQPMRRSMSMDSCNDRQFYLALQKVLRQHHSAVLLREDGKAGESSAAAAAVAGGSRAGGRLRRSFFSFSQSRSSRSAVLPI